VKGVQKNLAKQPRSAPHAGGRYASMGGAGNKGGKGTRGKKNEKTLHWEKGVTGVVGFEPRGLERKKTKKRGGKEPRKNTQRWVL